MTCQFLLHLKNAAAMPNFLKSKHQKLILRCYPSGRGFDKKPNSSELSYLLFYASTRRLKLEKVGNFIEKKTLGDLQHYTRYGNVQVSLLILQELIIKCNDNLNLFIENCVRIFNQVLKNGDLILSQLCLKVFKTFVQYLDKNLFVGNSELIDEFLLLVVNFLTLHPKSTNNSTRNNSSSSSWTIISIKASKYLSKVSTFNIKKEKSGENFIIKLSLHDLLLPIIFKQYSFSQLQDILANLDGIAASNITSNAITATITNTTISRRSTNVNNGASNNDNNNSNNNSNNNNNTQKPESILDDNIDDRTEDKINMDYQWSDDEIASECLLALREYFETNGLVNLLSLTRSMKLFLFQNLKTSSNIMISYNEWASSLYQLIIRWVNMQSRFLVMLNLIQELYNASDSNNRGLDDQILVSFIVADILHSDINLIGLSTLDILKDLLNLQFSAVLTSNIENDKLSLLLANYYSCVSGLTNHIYYHDQITDIIHELLYKAVDCISNNNSSENDHIVIKKITVLCLNIDAVLNCALVQAGQSLQIQRGSLLPNDKCNGKTSNIVSDAESNHSGNDDAGVENYDASANRINNRKRQKQKHLYDLIKQKVYIFISAWLNLSNESIFSSNNKQFPLWKYHCIFVKLAIIEIGVSIDDVPDFAIFFNEDFDHQESKFQDLFFKLFVTEEFAYPSKTLKSEEPNYGGILTVMTNNCLSNYIKTNDFSQNYLYESMIQVWLLLRVFGLNFILSSLDFIFTNDDHGISESGKIFILLRYMNYLILVLDKYPNKFSKTQDLKNLRHFQSILYQIQNNRIKQELWDLKFPPFKLEDLYITEVGDVDSLVVEKPMIGQHLKEVEFIHKWIGAVSSTNSGSNGDTFLVASPNLESVGNGNSCVNHDGDALSVANSTAKIMVPVFNNSNGKSMTIASFNSINGIFSGMGNEDRSLKSNGGFYGQMGGEGAYPSFSNLKTISRKPSKLQMNRQKSGAAIKLDSEKDTDAAMQDATALINDLFYSDDEFKQGKVSILV